jgi:alpha-2-macroglobulin
VFFADDFTGRQEIFYLVRVVNPGSFQISPARVEPMYQNGVQATSDTLHLDVPEPVAAGGAQ